MAKSKLGVAETTVWCPLCYGVVLFIYSLLKLVQYQHTTRLTIMVSLMKNVSYSVGSFILEQNDCKDISLRFIYF